jgi:superfamily II DNA or RNA helicase
VVFDRATHDLMNNMSNVNTLTPNGIFVNNISPVQQKTIFDLLTHKRLDRRTNNIITTRLYSTKKIGDKSYYILPRFTLKHHNTIELPITININVPVKISPVYTAQIHANQTLILDYLLTNIYNNTNQNNGYSSCVLNLQPGMGKTHVAMRLIAALGYKALIIVPNTVLLNQWKTELKFLSDITIGEFTGKKKKPMDITIAIVNSVRVWDSVHIDFKDVGLTIYDEIHEYCSPASRTIFNVTQRRCCLGLTGTPNERADKLDIIYELNLGKIINASKIQGFTTDGVKFDGEVTTIKYYGSDEFTQTILTANEEVAYMATLLMITKDPVRNQLIIDNIIKLIEPSVHVFVFSELREHLYVLASMLKEVKNINITFELDALMGGSSTAEINKAYDPCNASVIFTTYRYSSTGLSIVRMNALLFATPRKSKMRQILGRIMRRGSLNTTRKIIDIVDSNTCLRNQYYERKKIYAELGFSLIKN